MELIVADAAHPLRPIVERAVREVYSREFGATLRDMPPVMFALFDSAGALACVAGLRRMSFFSEVYLDAPIEAVLTAAGGQPVARERIIEVSTLAAQRPGAAAALVREVVAGCRAEGFEWAFFTATARLRALLRRSGIPLMPLAAARPDRVAMPEDWGDYYLHDPQVCAVHHAMPAMTGLGTAMRAAADHV